MVAEPSPPRALDHARLGFFSGLAFLFKGIGFVARTPRIWPLALVPVVAALVIASTLGYFGFHGMHLLFPSLYSQGSSTLAGALHFVLRWLAYITLFIASLFLGLALAQPVSGPALDAIAKRTRVALEREPRDYPNASFFASMRRSLRVTLVTLTIGTPIVLLLTILEFIFPAAAFVTWPAKLIVAGFLATWDLIDYPLSLENLGVRARTAWLSENRMLALGFGVGVALIAMIPFVGLFLLPCGVAGATMMRHARPSSMKANALPQDAAAKRLAPAK